MKGNVLCRYWEMGWEGRYKRSLGGNPYSAFQKGGKGYAKGES